MCGRSGFLSRLISTFSLVGLCLSTALTVDISISVPSFAQQDEAAVLDGRALELFRLGKYSEAIPFAQRALAIREKARGPNHPDVATSLNNLAEFYRNQGRYVDAEPLYKRSLAIYEKALGPNHPDVAMSLNNLALLYHDQGRYVDAEPLYQRSLAIREKTRGPNHPDVATALNNLAALYRDQGRSVDAEPLHKRSLAIYEKALGSNHPDVAMSLSNLAVLYRSQGRYVDALPLVRRTIADKTAGAWAALPVLFGAQTTKLISGDEAFNDGLDVAQRASQTSAAAALNALAVRFSAGSDRLARLVRQDQDLTAEAERFDKAILEAVARDPAKRNPHPSKGSGIASPPSPRNATIYRTSLRRSFPITRRCRSRSR
jgi:tetratricopeptide (TPR) repeat protein